MRHLSEAEAFSAMRYFLEAFDSRTRPANSELSLQMATLLGDLSLADDGLPQDPAAQSDWIAAVDKAIEDKGMYWR